MKYTVYAKEVVLRKYTVSARTPTEAETKVICNKGKLEEEVMIEAETAYEAEFNKALGIE